MVPEKLPETPFWFILCAPAGFRLGIPSTGEMAEWFKVHAWKACVRLQPYRGFESLSLRQLKSLIYKPPITLKGNGVSVVLSPVFR